MRKIDYSSYDTQGGLKDTLREYADSLLPCAANRLGISISELKKGLRVRLRPINYSSEVNADVNRSNSVISINESLMIFYHKMLKVFVSTLNIKDSEIKIIEKERVPWQRVINVARELLQAFLEDRILFQLGFKIEELTDSQQMALGLLTEGCEKFAISHELGHVIIYRSKDKVPEYSSANKEVFRFLKSRNHMKGYEKPEIIKSWTNELCADLIGLKLLLSLPLEKDISAQYKSWLISGAIISGELRWTVEDYEVRLEKEYIQSRTHPPEFLRTKYLSSFIASEMSDKQKIYENYFYFGMRILDTIFPQSKTEYPLQLV